MITTCRYANSGLWITPNGKMAPCCQMQQTNVDYDLKNFYNHELFTSVREYNDNGKILDHPSCNTCLQQENKGIYSRRRDSASIIKQDHKIVKPRRLDISLSNTCNLNCAMCKPMYSSKWISTLKNMPEYIKNIVPQSETFSVSYDQIDELLELISNTSTDELELKLMGGEPFYDKKVLYFLEKLPCDIKINIVTNLTNINKELLDKFSNLQITASIDGIYEIYEYIRGYNWEEVDKNLKYCLSLDNLKELLVVQPTITAYNYECWGKMYAYFKKIGVKNFNVQWALTTYLKAEHLGTEKWHEIDKSNTTPFKNPTRLYKSPTKQEKINFQKFTKYWNSHRNLIWQEIDVSKY